MVSEGLDGRQSQSLEKLVKDQTEEIKQMRLEIESLRQATSTIAAENSQDSAIEMPAEEHAEVPADWFTEPYGAAELRWWDGESWTNYVKSEQGPEVLSD